MKEKVLGEWITALRSGMYTQTQRTLQNAEIPNAYCCLGVLSIITSHRNKDGVLQYPDCTLNSHLPGVISSDHTPPFIRLNDEGPLDNYSRVLWLLETAPELFITEY